MQRLHRILFCTVLMPVLFLTGCAFVIGGLSSPNAKSALPNNYVISGLGTITAGFCNSYTISATGSGGSSTTLSQSETLSFSGLGSAKLYNSSDCSGSSLTQITLAKGTSSSTFSLRDPAAETISLSASDGIGSSNSEVITAHQIQADLVLGAPNFTTNEGLQKGIGTASSIYSDGTHLFVADAGNNRVLIWNSIPTSTQTPPDLVLGQPDLASSAANNGGVSAKSLNVPEYVMASGGKLFVADTGNNRVLIWNSIPTTDDTPADVVLGQPDFVSNAANNGGISASTLSAPWELSVNGSNLVVADSNNSRVLIWNSIPTANSTAANVVLGEPNFTTNTVNYPSGTPTQSNFNSQLRGVSYDGTNLFVSDYLNHRVLVWSSLPTTNDPLADLVLGQPNFTSNTANNGGVSGQSLDQPTDVFSDGTQLWVSDYNNNRVLQWTSIPTTNDQSANYAIGQPSLTSNSANYGGIGSNTLSRPYSAMDDGTHLFVADYQNIRLLKWNTIPASNQPAANIVLGQPNFTSTQADMSGLDGTTMHDPRGVFDDGNNIYVADYLNWRTLIWNSVSLVNNQAANLVLGQPDFATATIDYPSGSATSQNDNKTNSIWVTKVGVNTDLIVSDYQNSRVLIWNSIPTSNNTAADVVLGQPNFTSAAGNNGGVTSQSMYRPFSATSDGSKLYVVDGANSRVLIWNSIPTVSDTAADVELGQPNFTSNTSNNGGVTSSSLNGYPGDAVSDGTHLFVYDGGNSRVLIWNSIPTTNGQAADLVLGQPNFTSNTGNNGGISASSLTWGASIATDGTRLAVADTSNNRILIWLHIPTTNDQPADLVIGQPNFTSSTANNGGISAQTLWGPYHMCLYGNELWVADQSNHRVLRFEIPPY